jgi:poly-gamma-glutamate synthesis protein (capsule biosynthesis protein)
MKPILAFVFLLSLSAHPALGTVIQVETTVDAWPVWEGLCLDHPLPAGIQARRIDPGAESPGDRLIMTLGADPGAKTVARTARAPVASLWDAGSSPTLADVRAGRFPTAPIESIALPEIALPVDGIFPDQPGYPLVQDVSLRLQGNDPAVHGWLNSLPVPGGPSPTEITWVGAVGDIMPSRGVDSVLLSPGGAQRVFGDTLPILSSSRFLLGNLEAAATSAVSATKKTYRFKFDGAALQVLRSAGFTYLSVANNHTFDYGTRGFLDTLAGLSRSGIGTSGAGASEPEAEKPLIVQAGSTELRVLSFGAYPVDRAGFDGRATARAGEGKPGTLWLDEAGLETAKRGFSAGSFNIALVHGGEEWSAVPVPEQERLYSALVRAGADLVIGSHPHVLQGLQAVGSGLIVYSLGNFLFPGMEGTKGGQDSVILKVGVVHGKLRYIRLVPVRLAGTSVRLASPERTLRTMRALTLALNGGG